MPGDMPSVLVAPRSVPVVASPVRRSQPTGPCKLFVDLVLEDGTPGATIRVLALRNHFAHSITVRVRDRFGAWSDVVRDTTLMSDPHYEDDAKTVCVFLMPGDGVSLEPQGIFRIYVSNPSPRWGDDVRVTHVEVYEHGNPDTILADTKKRVQQSIREARGGENLTNTSLR